MTIRHLRLFIEVYKTENITKAAANLNMTQPTVTRAIKELENHYNIQLFDRINGKIIVTDEGRRFYPHAFSVIEAYNQLEQNAPNLESRKTIRIGSTLGLGNTHIPALVTSFMQSHPLISVKTAIYNSHMLQESLENDELDFALIEGEFINDNLYCKPFRDDDLLLILPPNSPLVTMPELTLDDLRHTPIILREKGSVGRGYIESIFESNGIYIDPIMESASTSAIIHAVHYGIGISFMPQGLISNFIASGYVKTNTITGISLNRKNYIVWNKSKIITPSVQEFMDEIIASEKRESQ